jgi:PKD repeat protein
MVYHNITHIYSNEGTYTPRLTMTNENGVTEYYKHQLIDIKLPVDFEYNVQYPYDNPLTAEFEADVFLDSPYSVRWNFGDFTYDPNTDNETSVTHTYGEEGIYSVTMTIEKNGVQYTKTKDNIISVYPKTMIELPSEIEPGTICAIEQIYESEDYNDNGIIRNVQVPDHYYVSTYDSYWIDGDNVRRISSFEAPLDMGDLDLGTTLTEIPSTWKYVETNENPIGQIVDKRINSTSTTIIIDGQTTTYTDTKYLFDMYIDNVNTDNQYECTYIVPAYIYNSYENGDNIEVRSSEWTLF